MRFQHLHPLLQILIAGLPALMAGGCVEAVIDTDCVDTVDRSFEFQTPAEATLQFSINGCRVDVEACPALCQVAMELNHIDDTPTRCKVSFDGDTVDVKVWYEVYVGGDNCPGEPQFLERLPPPEPILPEPIELESLEPAADLGSASLGLPIESQMRGLSTRTFDSLWSHGGRTCHA